MLGGGIGLATCLVVALFPFAAIGGGQLLGLTYPFYLMLAISVIVWYVLERTPTGRKVYATGGNPRAAFLTSIRTSRVILGALVACGVISGLAGLLESSQLDTGDPTIGPGYLLPVITAVLTLAPATWRWAR